VNRVLRVLRSAGILLGIWAVLALVAWIAGVFPSASEAESTLIAENDAPDAGPASVPASAPDAGALDAAVAPPTEIAGDVPPETSPSQRTVRSYTACGTPSPTRLVAAQLVGDARPEVLLACGPSVVVLGITGRGPELGLIEVALVERTLGSDRAIASAIAVGDVDGDSLPDLLVGLSSDSGSSSAAGVYLVRRNLGGGFEAPASLGAIAAREITLAAIDPRSGSEVVVLKRGDPLARQASDVWVFAGGPSPVRTALLSTALDAAAVAVLDLDRDGRADIAVAPRAEARLDVFFGDGLGQFPRTSTIALTAAATELVVNDLDSDGSTELAGATAAAAFVVRAGAMESLRAEPLGLDSPVSRLAIYDVDRDGRRDVVGIASAKARYWHRTEANAFEARDFQFTVEGASDIVVSDLDGNGTLDALVLGSKAGATTLTVIDDALGAPASVSDPVPIDDAPLVLRVPLE
jgi:hypothetical protein